MTVHDQRVLRVVNMTDLLRDRYYTVRELAARLETSKRTVQRDLRPLLNCEMLDVRYDGHIPIYKRMKKAVCP